LISGLALGHYDQQFVDRFFSRVAAQQRSTCLTITYHDYAYNPDANAPEVRALRASLERYTTRVRLRQGENGAPSVGRSGGALWDYALTELT
jgi:hypothetical protein